MHTVLIYHAHTHTRTTKKEKKTQNIEESYKKAKEKPTSSSSFTCNVCQKSRQ